MIHVQLEQLSHSYGIRDILQDIHLDIRQGDRIGLVGRNGEGKSTLMRLIGGIEAPERGAVTTFCNLAYVPQSMEHHHAELVSDWFAKQNLVPDLQIAKELGLREHIWELPIAQLSGGEQTKLALIAALGRRPDLLLLDEPTNHLDLDALRHLEQWLASAKIALLVISHDRRFLDAVTNKTWALDACKVTVYPGSYSKYAAWTAQEEERVQKEYDDYLKVKARLEEAVAKKRQWAAKGEKGRPATDTFARCLKGADWKSAANMVKSAKAIERRLEALEPQEKPEQRLTANVRFLEIAEAERPVLIRGEGVTFGYGERRLFEKSDFEVERTDRIALVGPNGAGKSTLLKLFAGALLPDAGSIRITPTAQLGYFDQVFATLDGRKTLLQDLLDLPNIDATTARVFLGSFLFKGDDVFRPLSTLSHGERVRYVFVKLILARKNTLILDEPSNHLDIMTRERIEAALADYPGALVCASHDRYFLEKMTNKVWELRGGKLTVHPYGFKEYWARRYEQDRKPSAKAKRKERRQQLQYDLLVLEMRLTRLLGELSMQQEEQKKRDLDQEFLLLSRQARLIREELA